MAVWPPAERNWTRQSSFVSTEHKEQEAPWNKDLHCAAGSLGGEGRWVWALNGTALGSAALWLRHSTESPRWTGASLCLVPDRSRSLLLPSECLTTGRLLPALIFLRLG